MQAHSRSNRKAVFKLMCGVMVLEEWGLRDYAVLAGPVNVGIKQGRMLMLASNDTMLVFK